jgi:hypothetical protein
LQILKNRPGWGVDAQLCDTFLLHLVRREATYYWRRRVPRALAIFQGRPHVFLSLRTTGPVMARRLGAQLDAILEDAAMLPRTPTCT